MLVRGMLIMFKRNHLSNTTCPTLTLFELAESCSKSS